LALERRGRHSHGGPWERGEQDAISLGKAAKLAKMSIAEFATHLSQLGIPVVDYDSDELLDELRYFER